MRNGFTIVELLVVLVIIAIIVSIVVATYGASLQTARRADTQVVLTRIDDAVSVVVDEVYTRNFKGPAQVFEAQYNAAGNPSPNDTISRKVAEVVLRRNALRAALPQRLEDMWGMDGVPGTPDDSYLWPLWTTATVSTSGTPRPAGYRHDLENAELLYLAISSPRFESDGSGGRRVTFLTPPQVDVGHVQDDNNNGIPELTDSWGNPFRFYLWPTRLIRPGGDGQDINGTLFQLTVPPLIPAVSATPRDGEILPYDPLAPPPNSMNHPLNQDPLDFTGAFSIAKLTNGLLASPYDMQTPSGIVTYPPVNESTFSGIDTYHQRLLMSAGPDDEIGLVEPNGFDPLTDTDPRTQSNPLSPLRNGEPLNFRDPARLDDLHDNISSGYRR